MTLSYILKRNRIQDSVSKPKLCNVELLEFPKWDSTGVSQESSFWKMQEKLMWCTPRQWVGQVTQLSPAGENT